MYFDESDEESGEGEEDVQKGARPSSVRVRIKLFHFFSHLAARPPRTVLRALDFIAHA